MARGRFYAVFFPVFSLPVFLLVLIFFFLFVFSFFIFHDTWRLFLIHVEHLYRLNILEIYVNIF